MLLVAILVGCGVLAVACWLVHKYLTPPHQRTGYMFVAVVGVLFLLSLLSALR